MLRAAALALLLSASAARAESHCWCRLVKSDCGDCNTSCTVRDYGGVADFGAFQLHKEALCEQACNDKLAGAGQDALCTDLHQSLSVPLPWNGEVHSCWHVGTDGNVAGSRTRVACVPPAPSAYPPPGEWWKTTLFDDFKGKPANASPEVASCYDRAPTCVSFYVGGPEVCPPAPGLAALDKCTWTVLNKTNSWSKEMSPFSEREVRVDPSGDGTLYLDVHAVHPDGSYAASPAVHTKDGQTVADHPFAKRSDWEAGYDCGWDGAPWDGHPLRLKCPFLAGGLVSELYGPRGFAQKYGRFEFRAKLLYGAATFGALWMLPVSGSWPGAGELDLVEHSTNADHAYQTLHAGVCAPSLNADLDPDACVRSGGVRWHQHKDGGSTYPASLPDKTPLWSGFHLYAVEWDKSTLRFSIDGVVQNTIQDLDFVASDRGGVPHHWWNRKKWAAQLPVHIPDRPFHFILTTAATDDNGKLPNPADYVPSSMAVDWVRVTQRCVAREDFCPQGGELDLPSLRCATSASGRPVNYPTPCVKR